MPGNLAYAIQGASSSVLCSIGAHRDEDEGNHLAVRYSVLLAVGDLLPGDGDRTSYGIIECSEGCVGMSLRTSSQDTYLDVLQRAWLAAHGLDLGAGSHLSDEREE